jgi:sugar lactone lactonase YvrE
MPAIPAGSSQRPNEGETVLPNRLPPALSLDEVRFTGTGLVRPECVLAMPDGTLHTADWRGGVAITPPDGSAATLVTGTTPDGRALRPNGIALRDDGSWLIADLGAELGGVYVLGGDGGVRPLLVELDGRPLPPTNFSVDDDAGRVWITVSTRLVPRADAYRPGFADGFVVTCDGDGGNARIAADGLGYTNECAVSPDGEWLYANETFGRRLSRFPLGRGGELGPRQTVTEFGAGTYPDGLSFDAEGHAWITSIVSNRVIRVAPDGAQVLILEDADPEHVDRAERAFLAGELGRPHLDSLGNTTLRNVSSLAFGGPDLRTAYLGCLLGDSIAMFRSPVAGHPPRHWRRRREGADAAARATRPGATPR